MRLLPNEEELTILNVDQFVLSNYRVQTKEKDWGESSMISIFLEDISSIEIKYKSIILYLVLGVLCVVVGFYISVHYDKGEAMIGGLVLGASFFTLWAFSRKHIILIYPKGGSPMVIGISGMSDDKVSELVHSVSLAKQKRVNELHKIDKSLS